MKFHVNPDECIGCGLCEQMYPEVFQMGADGKAFATDFEPVDEAEGTAAMEACPVSAIEEE